MVYSVFFCLFVFFTCHYSYRNEDMNVKYIIKKRVRDQKIIRRERKWSEITMVTEAEGVGTE